MAAGPAPRAQVLFLHSSSGHYGADRQLALLASGLDPDRYRPIVVLPPGELAADLRASGAEERRERVLALARRLGVADRLELVGFREDVETVYGAADVVAVPSTAPDPLPNTALEAAAAGCAVVAAAHGGLPEIIRDRETSRLFSPGDGARLAAVTAALLDDADQRERLGAAAAADVRARFDPARLTAEMQSLYDAVRASGRSAPGRRFRPRRWRRSR